MEKSFQIVLKNRDGLTVEVGEDEAIIDAVEAKGHAWPIGCRYGGCITCAAGLLEGKVRQPNGTALNKRQSETGYILLCVAAPKQVATWRSGLAAMTSFMLIRSPYPVDMYRR